MSVLHRPSTPLKIGFCCFPGNSRRSARCAGVLGLATLMTFSAPARTPARRKKNGAPPGPGGTLWNALLIMADDLGARNPGCDGEGYHDTPNLDRLAAEGMRFTRAHAAAPFCTPTRAATDLSAAQPERAADRP
jgi:hypothetical protein